MSFGAGWIDKEYQAMWQRWMARGDNPSGLDKVRGVAEEAFREGARAGVRHAVRARAASIRSNSPDGSAATDGK